MIVPPNSVLARLGLVLQGSNAHLEMLPKDEPQSPSGAGSDSDEDEDDSEEEGDPEADSDTNGEDEDGASDEGDEDESDEGGSSSDDEEDESEGGSGGAGESEDEGEEEEDCDGEPGEDADGEPGEDDPEEGEGSDADDGGEDDSEEGDEDSEPNPDGEAEDGDSEDEGEGGNQAGTGSGQEDQEAIEFAKDLLDALEKGLDTGLKDSNSALGDALKAEVKEDILVNEQSWRPLDPTLDKVATVYNADQETANALLASVKKEVIFLSTKMRAKFLSARAPVVVHGVRKGRDLSERRLVESVVEIRAGRRPTRPDWDRHNREECTLATAVVIDESGSMINLRALVARAALAIASPMDNLGSPCLVVGPRGGDDYMSHRSEMFENGQPVFHRANGVTIDVFKDWDESMRNCVRRFPNVKASGGTPLEDGIQYAMQELSKRTERHRVVLVLTDGVPANPKVCRRQIRQAASVGIHIIGIALDRGCAAAVKNLFPENVVVEDISQLPRELLGVLDSIMFPKVGRKLQFDVTLTAKKDKK